MKASVSCHNFVVIILLIIITQENQLIYAFFILLYFSFSVRISAFLRKKDRKRMLPVLFLFCESFLGAEIVLAGAAELTGKIFRKVFPFHALLLFVLDPAAQIANILHLYFPPSLLIKKQKKKDSSRFFRHTAVRLCH